MPDLSDDDELALRQRLKELGPDGVRYLLAIDGLGRVLINSPCPLCPRKRTFGCVAAMSALCQKRTSSDYSITSLARSKIDVGISMPSAFAVFRLFWSQR